MNARFLATVDSRRYRFSPAPATFPRPHVAPPPPLPPPPLPLPLPLAHLPLPPPPLAPTTLLGFDEIRHQRLLGEPGARYFSVPSQPNRKLASGADATPWSRGQLLDRIEDSCAKDWALDVWPNPKGWIRDSNLGFRPKTGRSNELQYTLAVLVGRERAVRWLWWWQRQ